LIPNLWRCGPSPLLGVGGALLHPVGLLVLLGVWSTLSLVGPRRAAAIVGRLLAALTMQSIALAAILLPITWVLGHFTNPTPVIDGIQLASGAVSWVVAVAVLLGRPLPRWLAPPAPFTPESARRAVPLALGGAVVSALGLWLFLSPPIPKGSALYPLALPGWFFDLATTGLASDECLALRALELRPEIGPPNQPIPANPPQRTGDVCCLSLPDPAADAAGVLLKRGPSAAPALAWVLERILARGNHAEQGQAFSFVIVLARWTGGHPLLDAWATSPARPPGQELAKNWQVCARLNRRVHIGSKVDRDCVPVPRRASP
jgi:hypothetical protein